MLRLKRLAWERRELYVVKVLSYYSLRLHEVKYKARYSAVWGGLGGTVGGVFYSDWGMYWFYGLWRV